MRLCAKRGGAVPVPPPPCPFTRGPPPPLALPVPTAPRLAPDKSPGLHVTTQAPPTLSWCAKDWGGEASHVKNDWQTATTSCTTLRHHAMATRSRTPSSVEATAPAPAASTGKRTGTPDVPGSSKPKRAKSKLGKQRDESAQPSQGESPSKGGLVQSALQFATQAPAAAAALPTARSLDAEISAFLADAASEPPVGVDALAPPLPPYSPTSDVPPSPSPTSSESFLAV